MLPIKLSSIIFSEPYSERLEQLEGQVVSDPDVGVRVGEVTGCPGEAWLVLVEPGSDRVLVFGLGADVAFAIYFATRGIELSRPMTHDLFKDTIDALGTARELRITGARDGTVFAELEVVDVAGESHVISCRPSDGVAVALRASLPIKAAEEMLIVPPNAPVG